MNKLLCFVLLSAAFPALSTERPTWLPEEFNSPEELAEAYQRLKLENGENGLQPMPANAEADRSLLDFDASSSEDMRKDFAVTIGTKVWINKWETELISNDAIGIFTADGNLYIPNGKSIKGNNSISMDEEPTPIPTLNIRYKDFFFSGSYYTPTKFDFETSNSLEVYRPGSTIPVGTTTNREIGTIERSEWDVALGWLVHPNVALTAGYKQVDMDANSTLKTTSGPVNTTADYSYSNELSGPIVGIAASLPIVQGFGGIFGLYTSYTHGFFTTDVTKTFIPAGSTEVDRNRDTDIDTDYDVLEGGFTFVFGKQVLPAALPLSSASIFTGYRYQWIESQEDGKNGVVTANRNDVTQGFTAGINLSF